MTVCGKKRKKRFIEDEVRICSLRVGLPVLGHALKHIPDHVLRHVPGYVLEHVPDRHLLGLENVQFFPVKNLGEKKTIFFC